jgi:hypothetical protein
MAKGQLIAEGTYQYGADSESNGRETWQISQLGHGGIVVTSRAEFPSYNWNLTYELGRAWSPVSLTIRREAEGKITTAAQRAEGDRWTAQVQVGDGETQNFELPFSNQHEVDFASPLFNTVTLLRTALNVGDARELDVIFIEPESLVPTADRQRYTFVAEEKIQVPAGNFSAQKYEMLHLKHELDPAQVAEDAEPSSEKTPTYTFWGDRHGIVLLYEAIDARLARYRRMERR